MSEAGKGATVNAAAADAIDGLRVALDALLGLQWDSLDGAQLAESVRLLEVQARRLPGAVSRLDAALVRSNVAGEWAMRSSAHLLQVLTQLTPREARLRHAFAERFAPRTTVTGQRLPSRHPHAAAALALGEISAAHATVIADAVQELPSAVRDEHAERVELTLVDHARTTDPGRLRVLAARVLAHLDPDGPDPDQQRLQQRDRELRLTVNADGTGRLQGRLTPECTAIWQTILTPLSQSAVSADDGAVLTEARTIPQRWHDGFEDAGRRVLAAGGLPDTAGLPTTLVITLTVSDLERRAGRATTVHGGTLSIEQALRLAADGKALPVVLADGGGILSYGRSRRLAATGQRAALIARDRGCTFPSCHQPASRSQVHHLIEWADGGTTDIDNLAITCGYHDNEAPRQGWKATMIDGIPHWIPPHWQPSREPRRNYFHHPELLRSP